MAMRESHPSKAEVRAAIHDAMNRAILEFGATGDRACLRRYGGLLAMSRGACFRDVVKYVRSGRPLRFDRGA